MEKKKLVEKYERKNKNCTKWRFYYKSKKHIPKKFSKKRGAFKK